MRVYQSGDFYRRLNDIIENLPQSEVISFEIKGGVNVLPTINITEYMVDSNGELMVDDSGEAIQEHVRMFKIIPIDEE